MHTTKLRRILNILVIVGVIFLSIILIGDNIKSTYNYEGLEYQVCDAEGDVLLKNNYCLDEKLVIEYSVKTRDNEFFNGRQKYIIKRGEEIVINIYELCNIDKNKIIDLKTNVKIDNFFLDIPIYVYIIFVIDIISILLILFYLRRLARKRD